LLPRQLARHQRRGESPYRAEAKARNRRANISDFATGAIEGHRIGNGDNARG